MRRHCGRPGCNAVATATFSFDATRCVVWLNPIEDGMPRAGDLCTRHADGMAPPKGWERVDQRVVTALAASVPESVVAPASASNAPPPSDDLLPHVAPKRKRKAAAKKRWDDVPNLFVETDADATPAASVVAQVDTVVPDAPSTTAWMPRFATDEDLDGVLDASTPLLSRAFNNARPVEESTATEPSAAE